MMNIDTSQEILSAMLIGELQSILGTHLSKYHFSANVCFPERPRLQLMHIGTFLYTI